MRAMIGGVLAVGMLAACADEATLADVALTIRCQPATSWAFPDTAVGQSSSVVIQVAPTAGAAGKPTLEIDGRDAGAFKLDEAASTCDNTSTLATGDFCIVFLAFAPTAMRAHSASLHIGATTVPLEGQGVARPRGLFATIRNVDSLQGFYDVAGYQPMLLTNEGTADAVLGAPVVTSDGLVVQPQLMCPGTLAPGAACEISVLVQQSVTGCAAGTVRFPSSLDTLEIPLTSSFIGGISVGGSGLGRGRVVSSPPGIDCGPGSPASACEHPFTGPVTLTAIPDPSHHFNGWTEIACDHQPTCVVAPSEPISRPGSFARSVGAIFASPNAHAVDVTFSGGGTGLVMGDVTCASSCQAWIEDGVRGMVNASTTSVFNGWGGACSSATASCDLGLVIRDRAITVAFAKDEREVTTLFPAALTSIERGGVAPDGDLVVTDRSRGIVARVSPDGALRWSTSLGDSLPGVLKIAPGGEIYVLGAAPQASDATLFRLAPTGAILWRQPAPLTGSASGMAVTANGIAVVGSAAPASVRMFAPDGTPRWSASVVDPAAVALDSTGMTVVASRTGVVSRFDATGAPLTPAWALPSHEGLGISLAFDAQDFLVAQTRYDPYAEAHAYALTKLDRTGATVFSTEIVDRGPLVQYFPIARDGGVAIIDGTRTFSWLSHAYAASHGAHQNAGGQIELYGTAGARAWGVDKKVIPTPSSYGLTDGMIISDAACNASGRCAVFGAYNNRAMRRPWIELFAPL